MAGRARRILHARNAKVGQLQVGIAWMLSTGADKKIRRFDILVDDLLIVRILEGTACLPNDFCNITRRKWLVPPASFREPGG